MTNSNRISCSIDPYSRAFISAPAPQYRKIRDLGPAVWLPKRSLWAIGRFDDVRAALRADAALVSGKGVAANNLVNAQNNPIVLTSDGEEHLRRRQVLMRPITPKALKDLRPRLEEEAETLVDGLIRKGEFDGMADFAAHLPLKVVADLVGLNEFGRAHMLRWAAAIFNALGVMNFRSLSAAASLFQVSRFIRSLKRESLAEDGWAARLFDAADQGVISHEEARFMVIDYVAPALDTTILASGEMLFRLATTSNAFEAVREDPELIPGVVNESVRLASPIRGFTRYAAQDFAFGDSVIPKGDRVLILYAAANRDERRYARPDAFDVARNPRDHVGWGHGQHSCAGMHLARLEMEALLRALATKARRIEVGSPKPLVHNVLQGFVSLPARIAA